MTLLEEINFRKENGELLVAAMDKKVGDEYTFHWDNYEVMELCSGELEGYCWIRKITQ